MTCEEVDPCVAVVGSTTAAVFEAYYIERALVSALRPSRQVVVMNNLGAYKKGERDKELIEGRGCELCYSWRPTHRTSTRLRKRSRR
jgi:hypothetical protein